LRIAIVSPFIDRRHGTERALAELIERLAGVYSCEIHLFAERVADLALTPAVSSAESRGSISWHRVPAVPGPQLLRFLAWFALNRTQRLGQRFDLVLSPGINCTDADIVIVHALFQRLVDLNLVPSAGDEARPGFLRRLHRRLYYGLLSALERRVYGNPEVVVLAVSRRTASLLDQYFGRKDVPVVHNGVDQATFSPEACAVRREHARARHRFQSRDFVLLLIGNDLATKGIRTVLESMLLLHPLPIRLLVVGSDRYEPHVQAASRLGLSDRCTWQSWGADVLDCYAAADAYVCPSREDSFSLPVLEAMACGLPAVTSTAAGASELITDGVDGFVLQDPPDAHVLAQILEKLLQNPSFRRSVGAAAAATAQKCTWDHNASAIWQILSAATSSRRRAK
jgi:glycosyltransferase involved in cell wall biosynthesis